MASKTMTLGGVLLSIAGAVFWTGVVVGFWTAALVWIALRFLGRQLMRGCRW